MTVFSAPPVPPPRHRCSACCSPCSAPLLRRPIPARPQLVREVAHDTGKDPAALNALLDGATEAAVDPRRDQPPGRGQAMERLPPDLHDRSAHRRRRGVLPRTPGAAGADRPASTAWRRSTSSRSSAWKPTTAASAASYKVLDALVTLGLYYPPRADVLPRAAEGAAGASARTIWPVRSTRLTRLLCRRPGLGPVHALEHPRFRGGRRRRRPDRPARFAAGHLRQRRQLFRRSTAGSPAARWRRAPSRMPRRARSR